MSERNLCRRPVDTGGLTELSLAHSRVETPSEKAAEYFQRYFTWNNTEHYHSGIGSATPREAHRGFMAEILQRRRLQELSQHCRRLEENRRQNSGISKQTHSPPTTAPRVA